MHKLNKLEFQEIIDNLYKQHKLVKISIFDENCFICKFTENRITDYRNMQGQRTRFSNTFQLIYEILTKNNKLDEFLDEVEKISLSA
jgi:hypothetical protein